MHHLSVPQFRNATARHLAALPHHRRGKAMPVKGLYALYYEESHNYEWIIRNYG